MSEKTIKPLSPVDGATSDLTESSSPGVQSNDHSGWKVGTEEVQVALPWFNLCSLPIETPSGHKATYYTMSCGDWVKVVTIDQEGKFVLVDQFRPVNEAQSLEVPGGTIEPSDPSPEFAGRRELLEETGYDAKEFRYLGWVYSNPALFNNRCHIIAAIDAFPKQRPNLDPGESMNVQLLSRAELLEKITDGTIRHSLVLSALSKFLLA